MLKLLLALLTGILLVLVHPRWSLWFLAPVAVAPLLLALAREPRPLHRFALGYVAGFVFWGGVCYWIHFVMSVHGRMGPVAGGFVFLLFCILKALHLGLFGLLAGVLIQKRWAALAVPALWVIIERVPDPFGFMWLHLGNAGANLGVPMRLAPVTGVYGLSFVFALMGTVLALLALRRPRPQLAPVLLAFLPLALPALPDAAAGNEVAVSVQPNIAETGQQWTTEMVQRLNQALELRSLEAAAGHRPRLVLWPEVPAPIYFYDDPPLRLRVAQIAAVTGAHVLMGTVAFNDRQAPLNAALTVAPGGTVLGRYDKMFLVPFGEYVPFPFGAVVEKVTQEVGDFVPGERIVTFRTGSEVTGAFICYESAFPHLVRRFVAEGATVLANLSNDGYFGGSAAREQHLALVRMRAAENRRWVLRSTNDGITASIDPAGRVVTTLPEFEQTSGRLPFSYIHDMTVYSKYGDWFAWMCGLAAAMALLASQWPHYRPETKPASHGGSRARRRL